MMLGYAFLLSQCAFVIVFCRSSLGYGSRTVISLGQLSLVVADSVVIALGTTLFPGHKHLLSTDMSG
jgi:hypothetical protein